MPEETKGTEYSGLALQWEREYLRIDTTNPPGNETRSAAFFKKILDQEGIENQVFEYAPGRADLWARVPHTTAHPERPIILLNHMDVVTSDPSHWKVPPFSASVVDGLHLRPRRTGHEERRAGAIGCDGYAQAREGSAQP